MAKEDFILFWGGTFSQWCPSYFQIDGVEYNCAEQYMMAKKALLFNDFDSYREIMLEDQPATQKALGKKVKGFDKVKWEKYCRKYVYDANYAKFTQNHKMRTELMLSVGKEIVEASPEDKIWGIGLHETNQLAWDKSTWQGTNWLGEAIMAVRQTLLNEEEPSTDIRETKEEIHTEVPSTLQMCFTLLDANSEEKSRAAFANGSEDDLATYHHTIGRKLRNDWKLWGPINGEEPSAIHSFFNTIGIKHGDDISGIILTSYHRYLNKKDIDLSEQVKLYWNHWLNVYPDEAFHPTNIPQTTKEYLDLFEDFKQNTNIK